MWEVIAAVGLPIIKWLFEKIAKKKLNDKEFLEYISAHQKKRGRAGDAAMDWEKALKEAQDEMAQEQT